MQPALHLDSSSLDTITALKQSRDPSWRGIRFFAQVESIQEKITRDGKPFREVNLTDATDKCLIRIWSDSPEFNDALQMPMNGFVEIVGECMSGGNYGLEFRRWQWRGLKEEERALFLAGSAAVLEKRRQDWEFIADLVAAIRDPRLLRLCRLFLDEHGARFQRAAAARAYHHARRGGLLEHTAQMMRSVVAVTGVYPELNRDLLVAGVLFHDCGKMWENPVGEEAFSIGYTETGELLGHIALGIELINNLWRGMRERNEFEAWQQMKPSSETVRLHLLHLIASHHGTLEFGSPVEPKTPEAHALHYIDNLDAKLEAVRTGYLKASPISPRIYERMRPLTATLVEPLPPWEAPEAPADSVPME